MNELDAAFAALCRDPTKPVRAKVLDMTVELRAVPENTSETSAAKIFAEIGAWEGESTDDLVELLSAHRQTNRNVAKL